MGSCVGGAPLGASARHGKGLSLHVPGPAVGARLASRPAPAPSAEPCALPLSPLCCGHVSLLERGDRRGAAGRREGVGTVPPADYHFAPFAPMRLIGTRRGRGAAVRGEGGLSG